MNVTVDISEIDACLNRLELETELEQLFIALVVFADCIRLFLTSPQSSPEQESTVCSVPAHA